MNVIYLLKFFNLCFLITGNGSRTYDDKNCMLKTYIWRCIIIFIFLINVYNGNKWAINNVWKILEPISILMIVSVELKLLGPLFSIVWRILADNRLLFIMTKFISTHEVLRHHLNSNISVNKTAFWLFIVGLLVHLMMHVLSVVGFFTTPDYYLLDWVIWSSTFIYNRFMYYEYIFLIAYVQIIIYQINSELSRGEIPVSELGNLYTSTLNGLEDVNRYVLGAPLLVNIIAGNVSSLIYILYHYILFRGIFVKIDVHIFYPILSVVLKLFDIILLYWLCQCTEREVRVISRVPMINRTTLILNERSITETNLKIRRMVSRINNSSKVLDIHHHYRHYIVRGVKVEQFRRYSTNSVLSKTTTMHWIIALCFVYATINLSTCIFHMDQVKKNRVPSKHLFSRRSLSRYVATNALRSHFPQPHALSDPAMAIKSALFIVAEGSEELELVAPVDILRRANVAVLIADVTGAEYVLTKSKILIKTDANLEKHKNDIFDAVVIPGGPSYKTLSESSLVGEILREHEKSGKVIAAICAAPYVLFNHGIAKGKTVTSYPSVKNDIENFYKYKEDSTVVDGNLVTSRGPATAVEFGLTLVEVLLGKEEKVNVAKAILYPL